MIDAFELREKIEALTPKKNNAALAAVLRAVGGLCADAAPFDTADAENGMGLCDAEDAIQTAGRLARLAQTASYLAGIAASYAYNKLDAE